MVSVAGWPHGMSAPASRIQAQPLGAAQELVGHSVALYRQNHQHIQQLEARLAQYGYRDLYAPLPPENPLDMLELAAAPPSGALQRATVPAAASSARLGALGDACLGAARLQGCVLAHRCLPSGRVALQLQVGRAMPGLGRMLTAMPPPHTASTQMGRRLGRGRPPRRWPR